MTGIHFRIHLSCFENGRRMPLDLDTIGGGPANLTKSSPSVL